MIGRYYLYADESGTYSTNSYELFILYLKVFDYNKYKKVMYPKRWNKPRSFEDPSFPADGESFKKGLQQEQRLFDCGLRPRLVSVDENGKSVLVCKWVRVSE